MDVILFGAGKNLIKNWNIFFGKEYNVVAVVDNYTKKKLPNGMSVKKTEVIFDIKCDAIFITLARQKQVLEVVKQLREMGADTTNLWYLSNGSLRRLPNVKSISSKKRSTPCIFFEVTSMSKDDYGTGIQRTVKNLYSHVKNEYKDVVPIQYFGEFITSCEYEYQYEAKTGKYDGVEYLVNFQAGDVVFFPDTSWSVGIKDEDYKYLREKGVILCFVVYDLTPIRKKKYVSEIHYELFKEWVKKIFLHADSVMCISKAVANDLKSYYEEIRIKRGNNLPIYVNYLGYDIPKFNGRVRKEIEDFVSKGKTFLMVGTVQPLKNHIIAVEALSNIYKLLPNADVQLLILGKWHDLMRSLDDIINTDETVREKILWIKDGSDEEIVWSYKNCGALLYPSQAEGFGLPLVEAAYFDLPILCSDIPVFREIAGDNATYFHVNDVKSLTETIRLWMEKGEHPSSSAIRRITWRESASEIIKIFKNKITPYDVLPSRKD